MSKPAQNALFADVLGVESFQHALGPMELARMAQVSKSCRDALDDDGIWMRQFAKQTSIAPDRLAATLPPATSYRQLSRGFEVAESVLRGHKIRPEDVPVGIPEDSAPAYAAFLALASNKDNDVGSLPAIYLVVHWAIARRAAEMLDGMRAMAPEKLTVIEQVKHGVKFLFGAHVFKTKAAALGAIVGSLAGSPAAGAIVSTAIMGTWTTVAFTAETARGIRTVAGAQKCNRIFHDGMAAMSAMSLAEHAAKARRGQFVPLLNDQGCVSDYLALNEPVNERLRAFVLSAPAGYGIHAAEYNGEASDNELVLTLQEEDDKAQIMTLSYQKRAYLECK